MNLKRDFACVIGVDDAPFAPGHVGPVPVVGVVYARQRLVGVLLGAVQKDGPDAAAQLGALIATSKFAANLHLIMLQGIALAGFNVVDVFALHEQLQRPILVVARRAPNLTAIREALLTKVPGGPAKWASIERLGPMEPLGGVYVQRVGLTVAQAETALADFTSEGHIPEPLRVAHLIAGALANGQSRGRV